MFRAAIGIVAFACATSSQFALADEDNGSSRRIEEVVVTAEKVESTVSDTSISITAIGEEMLEDLGIQNANEFVNYIPATTRDAYDIRIRGVGRNFRSLGGDPGIATYYNGIYSEDALIALTENGLFDVERIEVLRGPQGTLYGRNSIGGAINYITKGPTDTFTGMFRGQLGSRYNQEGYMVLSGPISDTVGYRLTMSDRDREGVQRGQYGTPDANGTNDTNTSLAIRWNPNDRSEMNLRINKRNSSRDIGAGTILSEGWGDFRGTRRTDVFAFGIRPVTATTAGAYGFTDPDTGVVAYGAPVRPGVDIAPQSPNPGFAGRGYLNGNGDSDFDDVTEEALTNGYNDEGFDQMGAQMTFSYDLGEDLTVKYLLGYGDFQYTYHYDYDQTDAPISDLGVSVLEDVWNVSHEVQFLWNPSPDFSLTSGLYYFQSDRLQDYRLRNATAQGRYTNAADYALWDAPNPYLGGITAMSTLYASIPWLAGPHCEIDTAPVGGACAGRWGGDPEGATYKHNNTNDTTQTAAFAQGTYNFNDQWALTLGVRWAEDRKSVLENRFYYFEFNLVPYIRGTVLDPLAATYGILTDPSTLTDLAFANVMMGAATATGDAESPITPTCALTAVECANPLRLNGGMPFSGGTKAVDEKTWSAVTGRINLDWTPNDDTLVYLSTTTGYRAGGYGLGILEARVETPQGTKPVSYDEEEVLHIELGYKATLLDGQLQLNSAVYTYQYDGYQDSVDIYDPSQDAFREIPTNTGSAVNSGFELEGTWLATDNLTLNANYSYTQTEYQDDVYLLEDDNPERPIQLFGEKRFNLKGGALKGIPTNKFTAWGNYVWDFETTRLTLLAAYSYTGEYNGSALERDFDKIPERTRTDLSLIWETQDRRRRARFFVDNVFDEVNFRGIGSGSHLTNYKLTGTLLDMRRFGVDVTVNFGG